jgi:diacylglycerol kinase (ATP)
VALGVLPLGTANALAADLGLGLGLGSSTVKAVEMLLAATPMRIPVGQVFYRDGEGAKCFRYFTVTAGVGADALLMSRLDARLKRRFGYVLYLVEGLRVWMTHSFPFFEAAMRVRGSRAPRVEAISQLLAVRIRDFGGVLHNLAPGATLHKDSLRLVIFKTRSRLHYLRFLLAVMCRRQSSSKEIEVLNAVSVECRAQEGSQANIFVEADGELLGALPVRIEIVPQALTLLIPPSAHP